MPICFAFSCAPSAAIFAASNERHGTSLVEAIEGAEIENSKIERSIGSNPTYSRATQYNRRHLRSKRIPPTKLEGLVGDFIPRSGYDGRNTFPEQRK